MLQINALIEVNLYSLSLYCETSNLIDAVWLSTLYQLVKFVDKCLTEIIYVQAQNTEKFKFEPRRLFFWTLKPISLLVFLLQHKTLFVFLSNFLFTATAFVIYTTVNSLFFYNILYVKITWIKKCKNLIPIRYPIATIFLAFVCRIIY